MPSQLVDPAATTGLAAIILNLTTERGLTVQGLSAATKIPRATLDRSLAGIRPIPATELFAIARTLGALPEDLIASARAAA